MNEPNPIPGNGTNNLSLSENGITLFSETNVFQPDGDFDYSLVTAIFSARSSSTTLSFTGANPNAFFDIDDVSVTDDSRAKHVDVAWYWCRGIGGSVPPTFRGVVDRNLQHPSGRRSSNERACFFG